ncbi:MAG: SRPBCC family protein [Nakamurella sp.]
MKLTLKARGTATPDEVWDRYARPSRWSEWSPPINRVDVPGDRLVPGLAGTVRGPLGLAVPFRIETVDPGSVIRSWTWRVSVGPISLWLAHSVIPLDGAAAAAAAGIQRTLTTLDVKGPAPVVAAYAPLAQLALVRLVRR